MGQDTTLANTVVETAQTDFLAALPAYNGGLLAHDADRLALLFPFINANSYRPVMFGFPYARQIAFTARETKEYAIPIPPKTYILMISGYSSANAGFDFGFTDKGSGLGLTESDYIFYTLMSGAGVAGSINPLTAQRGPFILTSPVVVTPPGQVNCRITNLATSAANIQFCLHCAVPINNQTLNTPHIKGANV